MNPRISSLIVRIPFLGMLYKSLKIIVLTLFIFGFFDAYVVIFFLLDEDEDGDRITVRSDDELQAMVNWVSI